VDKLPPLVEAAEYIAQAASNQLLQWVMVKKFFRQLLQRFQLRARQFGRAVIIKFI
jgi:hypothetical protein